MCWQRVWEGGGIAVKSRPPTLLPPHFGMEGTEGKSSICFPLCHIIIAAWRYHCIHLSWESLCRCASLLFKVQLCFWSSNQPPLAFICDLQPGVLTSHQNLGITAGLFLGDIINITYHHLRSA